MLHDRDADDTRLLERGDFARLLAKYEQTIVNRCVAALKGDDRGFDVAQNVMLRLFKEFTKGKRYGGTPYRVVVHKVIDWTLKEFWSGKEPIAELPDDWSSHDSPDAEVISGDWLQRFLATLGEREGAVLKLHLLGYETNEIAAELEMDRNAVYQRLFQGRRKFRHALADD